VELGGKVAVVTGAAMGIGLAVAKALTDAGAQVVVADRDAEAGGQAAAQLGGLFVHADVAEDDDLRRMIETAERFGGGRAGTRAVGGRDRREPPAVMLATQLALGPFRRRGGGAIVNVASVAGLGAGPH